MCFQKESVGQTFVFTLSLSLARASCLSIDGSGTLKDRFSFPVSLQKKRGNIIKKGTREEEINRIRTIINSLLPIKTSIRLALT